jgi:hypothetical protein
MTYSFEDKLAAIQRELKYRRYVYVRRVAEKKMTQANADKQIAIFEAIEVDYQKAVESGRLL